MIEIFDSSCSRSLGQSASIRAAIDILNSLSAAGRPGTNAMLCTYRGSSPRQEYIAVCHDGKWRRRASSAVKRSGICQQTIGCRRFVRNLRFSPAAERCAAGLWPPLSASSAWPCTTFRPCESVSVTALCVVQKGCLRDLRFSKAGSSKYPRYRNGPRLRHRTDCRNAHPQSSPIHPGVRMPRLPGLPAYSRSDCPKRHSRPAGAYEL